MQQFLVRHRSLATEPNHTAQDGLAKGKAGRRAQRRQDRGGIVCLQHRQPFYTWRCSALHYAEELHSHLPHFTPCKSRFTQSFLWCVSLSVKHLGCEVSYRAGEHLRGWRACIFLILRSRTSILRCLVFSDTSRLFFGILLFPFFFPKKTARAEREVDTVTERQRGFTKREDARQGWRAFQAGPVGRVRVFLSKSVDGG